MSLCNAAHRRPDPPPRLAARRRPTARGHAAFEGDPTEDVAALCRVKDCHGERDDQQSRSPRSGKKGPARRASARSTRRLVTQAPCPSRASVPRYTFEGQKDTFVVGRVTRTNASSYRSTLVARRAQYKSLLMERPRRCLEYANDACAVA